MNFEITRPTVLLNPEIVRRNIQRIADKAQKNGVRLCPHFKTHQSALIGEWFKAEGIDGITVSSLEMAAYFADNGWQDILVAFPVNWRQIDLINELAGKIQLALLVESPETVEFLQENLTSSVRIWLKIDTGYHRTGIRWDDIELLEAVASALQGADKVTLVGLHSHPGHSYKLKTKERIRMVYHETVEHQKMVQERLAQRGFPNVKLSVGDTPCCSVVDDFGAIDEIRPGNFVFYDWMQVDLGSCAVEDVAVAVACPVVAKHPERNAIVIYGGAVHFSKEYILSDDGTPIFGAVAATTPVGWGAVIPDTYVTSLSQEHGIITAPPAVLDQIKIGDLVMVLPIHSCLTVDCLNQYVTLTGDVIPMAGI